MGAQETSVVHAIQVSASKLGNRLFKNVRGGGYPVGSVKPLIAAIIRCKWDAARNLVRGLHMIAFGMQPEGSGDLIGWTMVTITPEMVGKKLPIFTSIEAKTEAGRVEPEQIKWNDFVIEIGGIAGVARCPEDYDKIVLDWVRKK